MADPLDPYADLIAPPPPLAPLAGAAPMPAPVSQDPRSKLALIAAISAAIAGGRQSGLGGLVEGVQSAQQQQDHTNLQRYQLAESERLRTNAQLQQQQTHAQTQEDQRQRSVQAILADLGNKVPTLNDQAAYDQHIGMTSNALRALVGSRLNEQVLRQKYPFVAATAEDRVKKAAQNWLDFNKDALKKDPSLIDRASMDVDLQDSGTPQRYPVRTVLQQAGFQPVAGLNGESLTAQTNDVSGSEFDVRVKAAVSTFKTKNHRDPSPEEFQTLISEATSAKKTPAEIQKQQLEIQKLKRDLGLISSPKVNIPVGSPDYRAAQDLAYGKLTWAQFRSIYPSRANDGGKKAALYDLARELNPNFDPAQYEMGYKFASSPQTQRALAAVDNVMPNIDRVVALSEQINRTDLPSVNALLNSAKFHLGDQKIANFRQMQKLIGDELGVALGAGTMTDMKLKLGLDVVDPNVGPEQFFAAMANIKEFLKARKQSLLSQMGPYGDTTPPPELPPPTDVDPNDAILAARRGKGQRP
jgi:hypothetical protein